MGRDKWAVMSSTCLVILDNSEWMRNGDFAPNRVEAQHDAVSLLAGAKTNQSAESAVGIMTSSGKAPRVLVTPTNDVGKILACLHSVKIEGAANVLSSLRIAQLALKHRVHKNHKPRIVLFVGSPIENTEAELVKLGAMLQKNECAVDIVNFGQIEENTAKLEAFVAAVSNNDNSHLVTIPPGPHVLSDLLLSSPIVSGSGGGDGAGGGGAGNLDELVSILTLTQSFTWLCNFQWRKLAAQKRKAPNKLLHQQLKQSLHQRHR